MPFVREERDRNSKRCIEEGEREPCHQSDLFVSKSHFLFDRFRDDRDNLPVEKIEHDDNEQYRQHIVGFPISRGCC